MKKKKKITFHIVTLFPESVNAFIDSSILKRAIQRKIFNVKLYNPRDFARDKHRNVDERPYGGGPGMVLKALPVIRAVNEALKNKKNHNGIKIYLLSPRGREFTRKSAKLCANRYSDIVFICGHYEGIDARVKKILKASELSIGPYTLTGGELPALVSLDAISRYIPHVLGNRDSLEDDRETTGEIYTRPDDLLYKGVHHKIPKILLSGHHAKIREWKKKRPKSIPWVGRSNSH